MVDGGPAECHAGIVRGAAGNGGPSAIIDRLIHSPQQTLTHLYPKLAWHFTQSEHQHHRM